MSEAMETYLKLIARDLDIQSRLADTFNTSGEMKAFAELVALQGGNPRIVIVVKWWHAWRTKLLCEYWFKKMGISAPIEVISCESRVNWMYPVREWMLAIPKSLLNMAFGRL